MITTITYRAVNQTNGDWYAGSTQQALEDRIKQHLSYKGNDKFHNSLKKNPDDWEWEVLSEVEDDDRSHEQYILDGWVGTKYCLNISRFANGGNGWDHITSEQRSKWSVKAHKTRNSTDPERYRKSQSLAGKASAEKVHQEKNKDGKSKHALMMGAKATEARAEDPEKTSKNARRAALRTKNAGGRERRQRIKATYISTGDAVIFDTIRTASKLIGGPYPSMQNHINQRRIFRGYLLERIDPEE